MAPKTKSKPKSAMPCRFFKEGRCRFSAKDCRFAHVLSKTANKASTSSHVGSQPCLMTGYAVSVYSATDDEGGAKTINSGRSAPSLEDNGSGQTDRYRPPTFSNEERRHFSSTSTWDMTKLDESGIKPVSFGPDFSVNDTHLCAIVCRPDLTSSLVSLSLGDSDSGNGAQLTDHGVIVLVRACRNLREVTLEAATGLTDLAFLEICRACPSIESLCITGNDKVQGHITSASLKELIDRPDLAPKLKQLVLWDQIAMDEVKVLSKARPKLIIKTGETLGDGIAANMLAAMTGGAQTSTWLGGKVVNVHTDTGWYGPGRMEFPDFGGGFMSWDSDDFSEEEDFDEEGLELEDDEDSFGDEDVL